MSVTSGISIGGVAGLVLGLLVVAGIVGTPLYLSQLQTDQQALNAAVRDDVEEVRRAVLHLDAHVSAMSDLYDALGDETEADTSKLRDIMSRNTGLLAQAKKTIQETTRRREGMAMASDDLSVNRAASVLYLAAGRILGNRAEFEDHLAGALWGEARGRAGGVAKLRRLATNCELRIPTEALSAVDRQLEQVAAKLDNCETGLSELKAQIAEKQAKLADLDRASVEARGVLSQLEGRALTSIEQRAAYARLSREARAAEAEAASLRNGSLEGGAWVHGESDDLLDAVYEGGAQSNGLRHLEFRAASLEALVSALGERRQALTRRQAAFEARATQLASDLAGVTREVDRLTPEIDDLLSRAARRNASARKVRQDAWDHLDRAEKYSGLAVTAANKRKADADRALRELDGGVDEVLQDISNDGGTQAALLCLGAEISHYAALLDLYWLDALAAKFEAEVYVAKLLGRDAPADIDAELAPVRERATGRLQRAGELYDEARTKIASTTLRTSAGTSVSGRHSLWQIDVAKAAVHLLEANLADAGEAGDAERISAQETAYELLVEAVRDREQSPLLTAAVRALRYLQRSVRPPDSVTPPP